MSVMVLVSNLSVLFCPLLILICGRVPPLWSRSFPWWVSHVPGYRDSSLCIEGHTLLSFFATPLTLTSCALVAHCLSPCHWAMLYWHSVQSDTSVSSSASMFHTSWSPLHNHNRDLLNSKGNASSSKMDLIFPDGFHSVAKFQFTF